MLVQHFMISALASALIFGSPNNRLTSGSDDMGEELQEQIDILRKQLKDLATKLKTEGNSNEQLEEITNSYNNLEIRMAKMYRMVDDLNVSLKQGFRQKLNELQSEMNKMYKDLDDRITALEQEFHKHLLGQTIAAIRDGMQNVAADNFKRLNTPILYLPKVIKESYKPHAQACFKILEFVQLLGSEQLTAYGFQYTYDALVEDSLFSSLGSECAFKIGQLQKRLRDSSADLKVKEILQILQDRFPVSLKAFVSGVQFRLTADKEPCNVQPANRFLEFLGKYSTGGHDYKLWVAEEGSGFGRYSLVDVSSGLALNLVEFMEKPLFTQLTDYPSEQSLFKVTLKSNEQVELKYVRNGFYLIDRKDDLGYGCKVYDLQKTNFNPMFPFLSNMGKNWNVKIFPQKNCNC